MRNLRELDSRRVPENSPEARFYGWNGDETCGIFVLPSDVDGHDLRIIASTGDGWDHVSVSRADRCPIWREMEQVKRRFFADTETAMQLHVPPSAHISVHPYCLHLWRPQSVDIPRPPEWMVA